MRRSISTRLRPLLSRHTRHWIHDRTANTKGLGFPTQPLPEYTVVDAGDILTNVMRPYFEQGQPLVLRNLLNVMPRNHVAMTSKFGNWYFWLTTVRNGTDCHVELGGHYASPNSHRADIPFDEFISYLQLFEDRFGTKSQSPFTTSDGEEEPEASDLIYLAQNDLFDEIYEHIDIPSFTRELGEQEHNYSTMIWMGPYGCVSPFHYDPLDNLLMQFVGQKQFLLCPPDTVLPAGTQSNTSSWDPYQEPMVIPEIVLQHTLLKPGDAIYIPKKWYHHVQTIQTSVSINTWFR